MNQAYVTEKEALRLRGDGNPDIEGYKRLLLGLDDGRMLRVAIGGLDSTATEESNFRRAAQELGIEVGFSELREPDNLPYLVVTRNPNIVEPHLPAE